LRLPDVASGRHGGASGAAGIVVGSAVLLYTVIPVGIANKALMSHGSPVQGYPEWQADYEAALLELDRDKLGQRLQAAEAAIFNHLQAISQSPDHYAERQAIEDALASLRVLKRDSLGFPDREKK
jgi:hypothetical protein